MIGNDSQTEKPFTCIFYPNIKIFKTISISDLHGKSAFLMVTLKSKIFKKLLQTAVNESIFK